MNLTSVKSGDHTFDREKRLRTFRFRFSLLFLLLLISGVCVLLGREKSIQHYQWVAARKLTDASMFVAWDDEYSEQWRGDARILEAGRNRSPAVTIFEGPPPVGKWFQRIALVDMRVNWPLPVERHSTSKFVVDLPKFPAIRALAIDGQTLSPGDLRVIGGLASLEHLWIDNAGFLPGNDVVELSRLRRLKSLALIQANPNGKLFNAIAQLPQLEEVNLSGSSVSNEDLERLATCVTLQVVVLRDNPAITDDGIEHLKNLRRLESLDIVKTSVTYRGAVSIARTLRLNFIDLSSSTVPHSAAVRSDFPRTKVMTWD